MIEIEAVQPTAREFRAIGRGWGAIHWACVPYTYAFLAGFLIYGVVVGSIAGDFLPPLLFSGLLAASWIVWWASARAVRWAAAAATKKSPAGLLPWKWSIGPDGILFANGLQTNEVDWRAVKTVREEDDRFLFLVTPAYNPVLPKRLLDEGQLTELRRLIEDVKASGRLGRGVD